MSEEATLHDLKTKIQEIKSKLLPPRVKLFIATSLDGYIAREDGSVDWLFDADDYGYEEFYNSVETLVMGRKTYEQVLSFGKYPYPGKQAYVFSRTLAGTKDENVEFVAGAIDTFTNGLRASLQGDIWLVGGAGLVQSFMEMRLIDDFLLFVHPVVLGRGIPLFSPGEGEQNLNLNDCRRYPSGLIQLHYTRPV